MADSRPTILCVLKILEKYSSEGKSLSFKEINDKMNIHYGYGIDRRTLYSCIETLITRFAYDISTYKENGKGYHLVTRSFEISEVKMMIDSICSSSFIPGRYAKDLIKKIIETQSQETQKSLMVKYFFKSTNKTRNKNVFYNVEVIQEAIDNNKMITFDYCNYDFNKKLIKRREEPYKVSPYGMVIDKENYYLICRKEGCTDLSHYLVDLINNVQITEDKLNYEKRSNIEDYANASVYAYGGEAERIQLKCKNYILYHVLNHFGFNVRISKLDDEHFLADFNRAPEGVVFWVLQFTPDCQVLKPEKLKNKVLDKLKAGISLY